MLCVMNKIYIPSVVSYLVIKGLTLTAIHEELDRTLNESSPSFSTIKKEASEFKRGRTSIFDDERSERQRRYDRG